MSSPKGIKLNGRHLDILEDALAIAYNNARYKSYFDKRFEQEDYAVVWQAIQNYKKATEIIINPATPPKKSGRGAASLREDNNA